MNLNSNDKLSRLIKEYDIVSLNRKYDTALDLIEQIMFLINKNYPFDDDLIKTFNSKLGQTLNAVAMVALDRGDFEECFKHLKRAQQLNNNDTRLKATTYNNLGCYYRKINKLNTALMYLTKCINLEAKLQNTKADTYINLCAVLSSLGAHQQAATHAMISIIMQQNLIIESIMKKLKNIIQEQSLVKPDDFSLLALANYNLAVEFQHLNKYPQAFKFYDKAIQVTKEFNPKNVNLLDNLVRMKSKIQLELKTKSKHKMVNQNLRTSVEKDEHQNIENKKTKTKSFYSSNYQSPRRIKQRHSNSIRI